MITPIKTDHDPLPSLDRDAYRERNAVERLIHPLKRFHRVATRYEKRAATFPAIVTIAASLFWLELTW